MAFTTNRLVELAISSDPSSALLGTTWSFTEGDLVSTVDAVMNAEVTGTPGIMQPGDTLDLDGDGVFEGTYQGRFNFTDSQFTLGDGTTIDDGVINIISVSVGGVSRYYMMINDSLASALDGSDLRSVTFGSSYATSPNTDGPNFDDASSYELVCFADGTVITTDLDDCRVDDLAVGDRVLIKDHGYQEIRWIGSRRLAAVGQFAPVVFLPRAIGNTRTLRLSRQHRVPISGALSELYFGHPSVLVPAHALVNGRDIFVQEGGVVEYFHILFDRHELVKSDGTWTESFYPTARTLTRQDKATRDEILGLFPELIDRPSAYGDTARPCLKPWEMRLLGAVATDPRAMRMVA